MSWVLAMLLSASLTLSERQLSAQSETMPAAASGLRGLRFGHMHEGIGQSHLFF